MTLAYPSTKAQMRDAIGDRLIVVEHEGRRWGTNSYWITPLDRLHLVLSADGISETGVYVGDKRLERTNQEPPSGFLGKLLDPAGYVTPLEPVLAADRPALISINNAEKRADETLAAVWRRTDNGNLVGLNARYLRLLTETTGVAKYGERFGELVLRQGENHDKPVGIFGPLKVRRGGYRDPNSETYRCIPETWHEDGERLLGVLMPVRVAS